MSIHQKHQKYIVLINIVHTETNIFETRMTSSIRSESQKVLMDIGTN